jgi:uncharacterized membrane protein YeiH
MYFGDMVFAFSGALVAGRHRMDLLGIVLIGIVTGIGGRHAARYPARKPGLVGSQPARTDALHGDRLRRLIHQRVAGGREDAAAWADAIGLSAFAVVGAGIAASRNTAWTVPTISRAPANPVSGRITANSSPPYRR